MPVGTMSWLVSRARRCREATVAFCLLTLVSVILLCLAVLLTRGEYLKAFFFNNFSGDLAWGKDTGMDFLNSIVCAYRDVPYTKYRTLYPPLANLFFAILWRSTPLAEAVRWPTFRPFFANRWTDADLRVHQSTMLMLVFFLISCAIIFVYLVEKILQEKGPWAKGIAVSLLLSYGSLYAIERGNIILAAIVLVIFFWFFRESESQVVRELALVSLAVAAALKLYPAVFAFVLLTDRHWARAVRVTIYGLVLLFLPFYFFEGTAAIGIFFETLLRFSERASVDGLGLMNLYEVLSSVLGSRGFDLGEWRDWVRTGGYALDVLLLVFAWRARGQWKAGLYLALVAILTQAASAYALLFMLVPFVALLREEEFVNRRNSFYFITFSLLLLPLPVGGIISLAPYYTWKIVSLQLSLAVMVVGAVIDGGWSLVRGKPAGDIEGPIRHSPA